jgi:hypothetical protein
MYSWLLSSNVGCLSSLSNSSLNVISSGCCAGSSLLLGDLMFCGMNSVMLVSLFVSGAVAASVLKSIVLLNASVGESASN